VSLSSGLIASSVRFRSLRHLPVMVGVARAMCTVAWTQPHRPQDRSRYSRLQPVTRSVIWIILLFRIYYYNHCHFFLSISLLYLLLLLLLLIYILMSILKSGRPLIVYYYHKLFILI
jgi:hypothetical protein